MKKIASKLAKNPPFYRGTILEAITEPEVRVKKLVLLTPIYIELSEHFAVSATDGKSRLEVETYIEDKEKVKEDEATD